MSASQDAQNLRRGEKLVVKGSTLTVSELDVSSLPSLRDRLIEVARGRGTTTYGALKSDLDLRHAVNGLGRLLDLVGVECARRGEPSLAALVVTQGTGEVGLGADDDAERQRRALYEWWARVPGEPEGAVTEFVLNGARRRLSVAEVRDRVLRVDPEPVRTHWVEIDGRRWPPKQALRAAMALTNEPFVSHYAVRIFRRLGLTTSPLPDEVSPLSATVKAGSSPFPARLLPRAAAPSNRSSALTDEDAVLAFRRLDDFLAAAPLAAVLGDLEGRLSGSDRAAAAELALASGFDDDLVDSALVVRERVGMLDTLVHAAVITQVLPLILGEDETVLKRPSLGAGNDPDRAFDLETTHRVAEFKLSSWKGADGMRQRSLFADVVGLSLDDTGRRREAYVVGPRPVAFLSSSNRKALATLSKSAMRVRQPVGMSEMTTVAEFTAAAGIHVVDLTTLLPRLR